MKLNNEVIIGLIIHIMMLTVYTLVIYNKLFEFDLMI